MKEEEEKTEVKTEPALPGAEIKKEPATPVKKEPAVCRFQMSVTGSTPRGRYPREGGGERLVSRGSGWREASDNEITIA